MIGKGKGALAGGKKKVKDDRLRQCNSIPPNTPVGKKGESEAIAWGRAKGRLDIAPKGLFLKLNRLSPMEYFPLNQLLLSKHRQSQLGS